MTALVITGCSVFSRPILADAEALPIPDVFVSSSSLAQSDTLLVVVKNEPGQVAGNLGLIPLRFFRNQHGNDWVAIVGISLHKKPGSYQLIINVPGKAVFQKKILVSARTFPVTKLVVPANLQAKGYSAKTIVTTIEDTENKQLSQVLSVITPVSYINSPFAVPLSSMKVVGPFGDIRAGGNYQIQHLGVDLKAAVGTFVYASNSGKVVFAANMPDYGNTLVIDHGLGIYSLYLHLSQFNVSVGQMVAKGQVVALSGDTGYVTGPHLHFSIKVRQAALDPLLFVQTTQAAW